MHNLKVAVFSAKPYDQQFLDAQNQNGQVSFEFIESKLTAHTAELVKGYDAVCVFVNDSVDATVLNIMAQHNVMHITLRCAGFNNVDVAAAKKLNIAVSRVPEYSPEAVAEHTVALMLTLNRRLHKAYNRVKEGNFNLNGLMGFNMHGKTVGVVGCGRIGRACIRILQGLGCKIQYFDLQPDKSLSQTIDFVDLDTLLKTSDIITLHCPLTPQTHHLINSDSIATMKQGVMLINTSRGGLVDANAVIQGLKSTKIGFLGLDVYEMESDLFFEDLSSEIIQDDTFQRLLTFPNVLITGHQGFFTEDAMQHIAQTTMSNIQLFAKGLAQQHPNFL